MSIPNGRNFASCYTELCKQQRLRPLPVICVTLPHSLDFTTDRVKMDDWGPILNSLSLDRCLKSISVRSRYQCRKPLEEINSEDKARSVSRAPVVLTRYLLEWLSHSLAQCVRNSSNLSNLELEGIPLPNDCIAALCIGLAATETLSHLSLQRCYIGDDGCELICQTISGVQSIKTLNLSQCDLTTECSPYLSGALRRQKLILYHETWKRSLRYREPDLEAMPGLRRLTLNGNPRLGDSGMIELIEAIGDSLWLKALDVQHCGLTDRIGESLLQLVDNNNTLTVLDVRQNSELNEELVGEVIRRLIENNAEGKMEYRWLGVPRKEQRVGSAGAKGGNTSDYEGRGQGRPRSAIVRGRRKPFQVVVPRKLTCAPKETKSNVLEQSTKESNIRRVRDSARTKPKSKMSLHLDLQSQIRPVIGDRFDREASRGEKITSLKTESKKTDVGTQIVENKEGQEEPNDLKDILNRLEETRREYVNLLEESKRSNVALAEEQARREKAEENLKSLQETIANLESVAMERDPQSRGFLLLSQESVEEICVSFDRLLNMLQNVTRGSTSGRKESAEVALVGADVRRRVASAIRKTKSERFRHDYVLQPESSSRCAEFSKKMAKSESDVRTQPLPASRALLERNIGDGRDVLSRMFVEGNLENDEDVSRLILEKRIGDGRDMLSKILVDGNVKDDQNVSRMYVDKDVQNDQDKSKMHLEKNLEDSRNALCRMLMKENLENDEDVSRIAEERNVKNSQDISRVPLEKNIVDDREVLTRMLVENNLEKNEDISNVLLKNISDARDVSRMLLEKNMCDNQNVLSRMFIERKVKDDKNMHTETKMNSDRDVLSGINIENNMVDHRDMLTKMLLKRQLDDSTDVSAMFRNKDVENSRDVLSKVLTERKLESNMNVLSKMLLKKDINGVQNVLSKMLLKRNIDEERDALSKVFLESHVKDGQDDVETSSVHSSWRRDTTKITSSREKAREIFARIVNGETTLDFSPNMD